MSRPVRVGTVEAAPACRARHHHLLICFTSPPTITLLSFFFPVRRSRSAGVREPMRLYPSMPLAQHHRVPASSPGWILALALLLALQVKFVPTVLLQFLFQIYFCFLATIVFDFRKWSIQIKFWSTWAEWCSCCNLQASVLFNYEVCWMCFFVVVVFSFFASVFV